MAVSSTTNTPTLTSLGVGSGLDAETIVTKLVALEKQPINQLQEKTTQIQSKISAFGKIQSAISSLRDAASKLTSPELWSATKATSGDTAVAFSTTAGAAIGEYSVGVSALAAGQSVLSNYTFPSTSATLTPGTLTIDVGAWSGTSFTPKSGSTAVNIAIDADDTIADIRDKINASNSGVKATIVTDSSGARLVMNSTGTGASSGFRITATDSDGNNTDDSGISLLAYDPASSTTGTSLTRAASNASATVNGVTVTSESNTFSDVLTGITMTVSKVTSSPVNVTVAQDNETITKAITDFATAYTAVDAALKTNTKYDEATKTGAVLQGDATALGLIYQFRGLLGSATTASSVFTTLSAVGLETKSGGALAVNTTKLNNALGNLAEMKKLFAATDLTGNGADGLATKFRALADSVIGFEGAITTRTAGLNTSISNNQKRQEAMEARVALFEKRIRAQYTALDRQMAGISTQSGYVSQMINAWNKSS